MHSSCVCVCSCVGRCTYICVSACAHVSLRAIGQLWLSFLRSYGCPHLPRLGYKHMPPHLVFLSWFLVESNSDPPAYRASTSQPNFFFFPSILNGSYFTNIITGPVFHPFRVESLNVDLPFCRVNSMYAFPMRELSNALDFSLSSVAPVSHPRANMYFS